MRTTLLDRHDRGTVWSLGGEWVLPPEWRLSAEWARVDRRSLWFAGARWVRSPWSASARYFWYGSSPDGRTESNRSGYRVHVGGRSGQVTLSATAGDTRSNAVNDPDRPVTSNQSYSLSAAFPLGGTNAQLSLSHLRARTVREHPDYVPVDKRRLTGRLSIVLPTRPWFWRFDARAQETVDRLRDRSDADFRVTALAGRRWEQVALSAGAEWYGDNATLSRAWRVTHLAPAVRFDYWGPRPIRLRLGMEARGGRIPRIGARAEMHLSERFRVGLEGDVRYRSHDKRVRYAVWLGWDFELPVPGFYSEGQIAGRLQVVNVDDDLQASGLEGAILQANGIRVTIDPSGEFLFPPLPPGDYDVTLDTHAVYEPLIALPLTVTVERGQETHVEIPVRAMSRLAGRVEVDWSNGNGMVNGNGNGFYPNGNGFANGNGNLGNIQVEFWREGVLVAWADTDSLGFYESPLLEPGMYVVRIAAHTVPRGLMPADDHHEEPMHLAPGRSYRKDLTLLPRPLRLRLDFEAEEP